MRVWIIGSEGMLGSTFHRYLSERDVTLFCSSRDEVDITDLASIKSFAQKHTPQIWINCSGYTQVDLAEDEIEKAYSVNSLGVENLALSAKELAAKGHEVKIIHFSTDYVFDGTANRPYKEVDSPSPLSIYGKSKLEGERKLAQIYPNYLIFRLSWLFGSGGHNFVKTILSLLQKQEVLHVVDDQIGRPTYCQDVVESAWSLYDQTGLFHLCNQEAVSWHGFAQEIAHQAQQMGAQLKAQLIEPISTSQFQRKAKRPSYSILDTEKIESFGVYLRPWHEALSDCLRILIPEQI